MRTLGVFGANLPTKKTLSVQPADFAIAGLVGKFERKFSKAFSVKSPQEVQDIFGYQTDPAMYGWDAVNGFFANTVGVAATLWISSHVGYTGSAIDAVRATLTLMDTGTPTAEFTVKDAYIGEPGYGVSGNRTGVTIASVDRFTTTVLTTGAAGDTWVILTSVAGVRIGDIIKAICSGGTPGTIYRKVTSVDEATKRVSYTTANSPQVANAGDVVTVEGFQLRLWRKGISGAVVEVDPELGRIICASEPECTDFYVVSVFAQSKWVVIAALADTPAQIQMRKPATLSVPTYLATGADGTAPTTAAHWGLALSKFDNVPVRLICNPETSTIAIQQAIETYCKARSDLPKVVGVLPESQTKAQLITIGQNWQRSDDVLALLAAQWLLVTDPFAKGANAVARNVPPCGHVMGLAIRVIGIQGIHYAPAQKDSPIYGALDVSGDQMPSDTDRTSVAEAGVNCIQNLTGFGIVLRNAFAPSTATEFLFFNGLMMREYIKVSAVQSLQGSENTPNSINRVKADRMAILTFLYRLWQSGSTGSVPTGESFGQGLNADGSETVPAQHFEVRADLVNNPQDQLNLGLRNIDVYFTYPAPAGSIRIGVGILLRS